MFPKRFCAYEGPDPKCQPQHLEKGGGVQRIQIVLVGVELLVAGQTWKSAFQDRPLEDLLGELGLVVVLVGHRDHNLHRLLNSLSVRRHSMREELQEPSEGYSGRGRGRSCPTRAAWAPLDPTPFHSNKDPPAQNLPHTCAAASVRSWHWLRP